LEEKRDDHAKSVTGDDYGSYYTTVTKLILNALKRDEGRLEQEWKRWMDDLRLVDCGFATISLNPF